MGIATHTGCVSIALHVGTVRSIQRVEHEYRAAQQWQTRSNGIEERPRREEYPPIIWIDIGRARIIGEQFQANRTDHSRKIPIRTSPTDSGWYVLSLLRSDMRENLLVPPVIGHVDNDTLPYFRRAVGLVVYSNERRVTPADQVLGKTWPTRAISMPNASTVL